MASNEARAAGFPATICPDFATVYEAGEAPAEGPEGMPALYIAQELVEGDTLAQRLRRGRLDVDEVRVTARGREEVLLSSIDELTRQLRRRLGESLASIDRTDPPFTEYTTSSLEALDLAGRGQLAWGAADAAGAERAYREALEHDPQFAMARGSLGLLLIQLLGQPEEGRQMLTRALEDAGDASQREHLHLRAAHRQFVTGDLEGALEDYRFISELYPDGSRTAVVS